MPSNVLSRAKAQDLSTRHNVVVKGEKEAQMGSALPTSVERYVKEIKDSNPDYDDAKVWATAWSIYCKHKRPNSPRCKQDDYFQGRSSKSSAKIVSAAHVARQVSFGEAREAVKTVLVSQMSPTNLSMITQGLSRNSTLMRYLISTVPVFGWDSVMRDLFPFPFRKWMESRGLTEPQVEAQWTQIRSPLLSQMQSHLKDYHPSRQG